MATANNDALAKLVKNNWPSLLRSFSYCTQIQSTLSSVLIERVRSSRPMRDHQVSEI
jgi:hypothetical protein